MSVVTKISNAPSSAARRSLPVLNVSRPRSFVFLTVWSLRDERRGAGLAVTNCDTPRFASIHTAFRQWTSATANDPGRRFDLGVHQNVHQICRVLPFAQPPAGITRPRVVACRIGPRCGIFWSARMRVGPGLRADHFRSVRRQENEYSTYSK